ncbi:MAG: Ig-like domain-containing protein [Patescibacteria group bacterium]|nr:Ig-like domain-containing protein [Patescibacteria group bacterium]MBU2508813.1 Ig-like domain-containing protein [Patescibacteria group bacterium]
MKKYIFNSSKIFLFGLLFTAFIMAPFSSANALVPIFTLGGNAYFDQVWQLVGSSYIDYTNDAEDEGGADVVIGGTSPGHTFYFGMRSPFDKVYFDMEVWGQAGTLKYYYSKPTTMFDPVTFVPLTLTSNPNDDFKTTSITGNADIGFTPPSNWIPKEINGVTAYWIKVVTETPYMQFVHANRVKARVYNLKLKFNGLQGDPWLEDLPIASVQPGGTNWGEWNAGSGIHYYALPTDGAVYTLNITTPPGYVNQSIETLPLTTAINDHTVNPLVIIPAMIVKVRDEVGNVISNATVTYDGLSPEYKSGQLYYFAHSGSGSYPIVVSSEGYVTVNGTGAGGNSAMLSVANATGYDATVVNMSKVGESCDQAGLLAGQESFCNALLRDFMLIVQDQDNKGISGASYTIYKDVGLTQVANDLAKMNQESDATGTTDQEGYGRAALASGNYYFKISAQGFQNAEVGPFALTSGMMNGYIVKINPSGDQQQPQDTVVSASKSSVGVSPSSIVADNLKTATITVIARNAGSEALSGKTVTISSSLAGSAITPAQVTTDSNGTATFTIKSSAQGSSTLTAVAGNVTLSSKPTVNFTAPIQAQCQNPVVSVGSLVKLPDDGDVNTQMDSAVYYYGSDCKRHAFPNSKSYFTWYANFDQVTVVQPGTLASMPLGQNVTYRPGVKMVKFTTDPKVYAVAKGGVLRWVKTETVAINMYGATWNKQIDDISDAFYINYSFGSEIADATGYNKQAEMGNALVVDDSL